MDTIQGIKAISGAIYNKLDETTLKHNWNRGNGLKFDGSNDYVNLGNVLNFEITDEFSIGLILKFNNFNLSLGSLPKIFTKISPAFTGYNFQINSGGRVNFTMVHTSPNIKVGAITVNTLSINTNYNLIVTKSTGITSAAIKIYIDGISQTLTDNTLGVMGSILNTSNARIGGWSESEIGFLNGTVFDCKVFNKELTQSEVSKLYQTSNQLIPSTAISNCVADWRFEDKSGTILNDSSPSNYDGALTNYAAGTTALGATNVWVDKYGNSITQY